jgi:Protein of unknown function (DUF1549)/Protein of unknown function (DUF1553)
MTQMVRIVGNCLAVSLVLGALAAADDLPLYQRIDAQLEARAGGPIAQQASDAEFLRRVYLDLAGRVPSLEETKAFLADSATDKRERLIDRLLASEDHVRRMTQVFHVMLMERMGDHAEWQKFLRSSFEANKPWDQLCREILSPNADDEATRGSALWYTKRLEKYGENPVDLPGLVRDVGRLYLGIDVQCAQCHDHLFIDDYKQEFYHGLFAFVGQTTIRTDVKFPAVGLRPLDKKVEFMSVFVKEPKSVGPKLPLGDEIELPAFTKGEEFEQPPDKKKNPPGVPKFHTLRMLAEQLPRAENKLFTRNIANRLWWLMMGRGLVDPLDLQHAGNPPSHPELLDSLADDLAVHQFDMRWLLSQIARSRAYQRSSVATDIATIAAPPSSYRVALEKPLTSEQMLASIKQALGNGQPLTIPANDKSWTQWQANFDKALANPAREPEVGHSPTVKAALFVMHDAALLGWIKAAGDNLTARLLKLDDPGQLAEELYLAVLSRPAGDEETTMVREYLASRTSERERAVVNLVWSLVASNEFCANH